MCYELPEIFFSFAPCFALFVFLISCVGWGMLIGTMRIHLHTLSLSP